MLPRVGWLTQSGAHGEEQEVGNAYRLLSSEPT